MHAGFVYSLVWLTLAGCRPESITPPLYALHTEGFLIMNYGHATAKVWGISFDVPEAGFYERCGLDKVPINGHSRGLCIGHEYEGTIGNYRNDYTSGHSVSKRTSLLLEDAKRRSGIYKINLGNVVIVLEKRYAPLHETVTPTTLAEAASLIDGTITLAVNGKRFGSVEVGSKVEIDEKRNVKVNGTAREPRFGPVPKLSHE